MKGAVLVKTNEQYNKQKVLQNCSVYRLHLNPTTTKHLNVLLYHTLMKTLNNLTAYQIYCSSLNHMVVFFFIFVAFSLITASKREPDVHFMSPHTESDFDITQWSKTDQLSSIL